MRGLRAAIAGLLLLIAAGLAIRLAMAEPEQRLTVHGLCYGRSDFPEDQLFAGGDASKQRPFAWMVYLVRVGNKRILVDTGFRSEALRERWGIRGYVPLPTLLSRLGEVPGGITHVLLTHSHVDHAGNLDLFPNARFYLQEQAYQRIRAQPTLARLADRVGARLFTRFDESIEILPGLRMFHVGGHTPGSSAIELQWRGTRLLFPGDNAYLIANCRDKKYVGAVTDPVANRAFIDRYQRYPGKILSHHDPKILGAFPTVRPGIVEILRD